MKWRFFANRDGARPFTVANVSGHSASWLLASIIRGMALVVFLRGVNVGGHRTFRPSVLAQELSEYDVVNVGAAGTFFVRKPQSRAKFRAALLPKLPFEADVMLCDGRDLLRLEMANPFGTQPSHDAPGTTDASRCQPRRPPSRSGCIAPPAPRLRARELRHPVVPPADPPKLGTHLSAAVTGIP